MRNRPNRFLAGIWPVVQREIREAARGSVNHRLRFWSVIGGTVLFWCIVTGSTKQPAQLGAWLMASLHTLLVGLILLIVPALAADCIAREKRDGTLGLLFLTPLSAGGIVAGKMLVQGLRAFTLWLAVLPILTIPFMEGGVNWFDAFTAVSLEFCATILCLAAGLLASSLVSDRNKTFLLAIVLGAAFLFLFCQVFMLSLVLLYQSGMPPNFPWWEFMRGEGIIMMGGFGGWSSITARGRLAAIWESLCLAGPVVSLLFLYLTARFAARRIELSWQDKPSSLRQQRRLQRYCTPLLRDRFQKKMRHTLDWNPIAWLQQYSWKARLGKWGQCLAVLLFIGAAGVLGVGRDETIAALILALAASYTFVGVNSFLEEKRSGALELLLITPISVNKLIFGRAWGLWKQFLPAALVFFGFYYGEMLGYLIEFVLGHFAAFAGFRQEYFHVDAVETPPIQVLCMFLALPIFATYFALRVKNLIVAGVLTWIALWIPAGLVMEAQAWLNLGEHHHDFIGPYWAGAYLINYSAFALLACFLLRHSLSRRIYSF